MGRQEQRDGSKRREQQRRAARKYRLSMTEKKRADYLRKKRVRKKRQLASMSTSEKEKWKARQRKYHANYVASLAPEQILERKTKQARAKREWWERLSQKKTDVETNGKGKDSEKQCSKTKSSQNRAIEGMTLRSRIKGKMMTTTNSIVLRSREVRRFG